jgi:hypothetical protein
VQLGCGSSNDLSIAATVTNLTISGAGESKTFINGASPEAEDAPGRHTSTTTGSTIGRRLRRS